jgi:lantibiotic modifying enzyme
MEQGIGWYTKSAGAIALTGFSHGAAGVSWALLELAVLTGEERFREAARAGIAYERSLFSREMGNWPDLREQPRINPTVSDHRNTFMVAWCHGAPGIGLARLCALSHLDDASLRAEVAAAVDTTLGYDFGSNHSLCHGGLGNLELLLQAAHVLDEPSIHSQLNRTAATILESIKLNGWLCGVPLGVEEPSLMTGIAGIGYELLRVAEPARVPSVLTLEPPLR